MRTGRLGISAKSGQIAVIQLTGQHKEAQLKKSGGKHIRSFVIHVCTILLCTALVDLLPSSLLLPLFSLIYKIIASYISCYPPHLFDWKLLLISLKKMWSYPSPIVLPFGFASHCSDFYPFLSWLVFYCIFNLLILFCNIYLFFLGVQLEPSTRNLVNFLIQEDDLWPNILTSFGINMF